MVKCNELRFALPTTSNDQLHGGGSAISEDLALQSYNHQPVSSHKMKASLLALLPSCAFADLQQKQAQLSSLESQLDAKLARYQDVINLLSSDSAISPSEPAAVSAESVNEIYDVMDATTLKLTSLIARTEKLMKRVGEHNKQVLQEANIQQRYDNVLSDETARRDRFLKLKSNLQTKDEAIDDVNATDEAEDYISLADLHALFDREKIISPSEKEITNSALDYTQQLLAQQAQNESATSKQALDDLEKKYAAQFESIITTSRKETSQGSCVTIPQSVQLVEDELEAYYYGVNMHDFASYENGGSVVYALTSSAYRPEARNEITYERDDKSVEKMWFENQEFLNTEAGVQKKMKLWLQQNDIKEWYEQYKLEGIRPYLPQDWERTIDLVHSRLSSGNWDEYTPRGAMDALVPDYVYQSLGFGEYAQTAGPEVSITSGSKHMGSCFPLSMHPDDDPALSYLSRLGGFDGSDELGESLQSLSGPKYTILLLQPIYIDAVTLEHKSFPISKVALGVGLKGGESAPRHVRVVGFPPCADEENEECTTRGFDIMQPIELGTIEYQRVTVSGREDDYGGYEDEEQGSQKRRRRSTQTFAVRGGKWTPPSSGKEEAIKTASSADTEQQCSFDDQECQAKQTQQKSSELELDPLEKALAAQGGGGECKPNYDDIEAVPDCEGDSEMPSESSGSDRYLVAAVTFIIEENWGHPEYTCLYRVQVHGDTIQV